jgi:predicted amidohydrolase YtcJ
LNFVSFVQAKEINNKKSSTMYLAKSCHFYYIKFSYFYKMKLHSFFYLIIFSIFFNSCKTKTADLVIYNAKVYTVDSNFSIASAFAIKDGKFLEIGNDSLILAKYANASEKIDAQQQFIYPGFIDAHCHFTDYAVDKGSLELYATTSFNDVLDSVKKYNLRNKDPWLIGRGWNQNAWVVKEFPTNDSLNFLFPDKPILLTRIDGHACLCNNKALEIAGITANTKIFGGEIILKNGKPTGLLIDNAATFVEKFIPLESKETAIKDYEQTQQECFELGLTSLVDCGVKSHVVDWVKEAQHSGKLKMRLALMLADDSANFALYEKQNPYKDDYLHIIGFKIYLDGALGSRGAFLQNDYSDEHNHKGLILKPIDSVKAIAARLINTKYQMCTHAIGDEGNNIILNIYAEVLKQKNDRRWRVEHAQCISKNDFALFKNYSIIPSVQPTHATSDMPWALTRLGSQRLQYAYAYKTLLNQNNWLPLGTDFPVEYPNPFYTFYSAVFRIYDTTKPAFQMQDALTRQEALRGMTIWAAKASFEENEKGSIEKNKFADFIMCNTDLMQAQAMQCKHAKVSKTYVGGACVWEK